MMEAPKRGESTLVEEENINGARSKLNALNASCKKKQNEPHENNAIGIELSDKTVTNELPNQKPTIRILFLGTSESGFGPPPLIFIGRLAGWLSHQVPPKF